MLCCFRGAGPFIRKRPELDVIISDYDRVLLSMPVALCMNQSSVRRHLVWKRMLAASADGLFKINQLARHHAERMSCHGDTAHEHIVLPCWLSLNGLARQINCPPLLLFMWAVKWRRVLTVAGTVNAMKEDAAGVARALNVYMGEHCHPPSPHRLLQFYMETTQGTRAGSLLAATDGVSAKRPRLSKEMPRRLPRTLTGARDIVLP